MLEIRETVLIISEAHPRTLEGIFQTQPLYSVQYFKYSVAKDCAWLLGHIQLLE